MGRNDNKIMANLILVKTFLYRHEAEIAKGLLKEKNIESVIQADDAGGAVPMASLGMGNVKLLVQDQDAVKAQETLEVLDTNVDGTLWAEDTTLANFPEVKTTLSEIKKESSFKAWPLVVVGVIIFAIIYFFLKK